MSQIICLDTETTGLDPNYDEILQLSIVGDDGFIFDKFYKPAYHTEWNEAQAVHGISPYDVANCEVFTDYNNLQEIQDILNQASLLVGYNINYDLNFLRQAGLNFSHMIINDVMYDFADFFGAQNPEKYWLDKYSEYKKQKLVTAAEYYNYMFNAHNSLEDVKATLYVWDCLQQDGVIPVNYTEMDLAQKR